jgi:hypothetical protein
MAKIVIVFHSLIVGHWERQRRPGHGAESRRARYLPINGARLPTAVTPM